MPNAHGIYLEAIAKAQRCETTMNYMETPALLPSEVKNRRQSIFSGNSLGNTTTEESKTESSYEQNPSLTSLDMGLNNGDQDNAVSYAFFLNVIDPNTGLEDDKVNTEDILKMWRMQYGGEFGLQYDKQSKLTLKIHEYKQDQVQVKEVDWMCPLVVSKMFATLQENAIGNADILDVT